jgi:hypothetical protein
MRNTAASASLESGEIGLAARARLGTAGAQEATTTNLFRPVSDAELADVGANGLRMAPGDMKLENYLLHQRLTQLNLGDLIFH